jgi:SAM-dependent methyltransferase
VRGGYARQLLDGLALFGLDLRKIGAAIRGVGPYVRDLRALRQQARRSDLDFPFGHPFPCLADRYLESGVAGGHYFHQDLLVARKVFVDAPRRHLDVGSRVDGFVAHVATFRPIEVMDIRPLESPGRNIKFFQCDLMGELPPSLVACCDSLSCLHALEHFGLGRYGDPIRFDGHLRGFDNLARMLEPDGKLYLSVPIGPQRIEFNAHRVFAIAEVLRMAEPGFVLDSFSFVDDAGRLHEDAPLDARLVASNADCLYGCGIFEFTKKALDRKGPSDP